ncbi:uncharacterized protein LODBEIA_P05050 [Lodderomyces beijingensis]|uniref:Decapping nuclease n=1 Tax=Lodderomyces beijingensis TaxID=1775926 RepID=A0ABP0ZDN5_9ASCO
MSKSLPLSSRAKTTTLKKPKELFTYTRDINGEHHYNANQSHDGLAYYYLPDTAVDRRIDLQSGFKDFKKIPLEQDLADFKPLLDGIIKYETETGTKVTGDIVTFRGIMTKILSLPYNSDDSFDLVIVPFDGQLFINSDYEIELNRRKEQETRQRQTTTEEKYEYIKKCEYSGYKFETIATLPDTWANTSRKTIESRHKKPVNNYEQYLSVIKTGIGPHHIVLAGEVDCCWDYTPDKPSQILQHYVELKTSRVLETSFQVQNFEKKLFKTWCQCFLLGITKVAYGFRDDSFILRNVELYNTEEIPVLIKENPMNSQDARPGGSKNKNPVINCTQALKWYGAVVEWLNHCIDKSDESRSWLLKYDAIARTFTLTQASEAKNDTLRSGQGKASVISEEFRKWRKEEFSVKRDD